MQANIDIWILSLSCFSYRIFSSCIVFLLSCTRVSSIVFYVFLKAKLGIPQIFTQTTRKCRQDDCVFVTLRDWTERLIETLDPRSHVTRWRGSTDPSVWFMSTVCRYWDQSDELHDVTDLLPRGAMPKPTTRKAMMAMLVTRIKANIRSERDRQSNI